MRKILDSSVAFRTTFYFFTILFLAIGASASLAFLMTAKWYVSLAVLLLVFGGWYIFYLFNFAVMEREKSQDSIKKIPEWQPGLKMASERLDTRTKRPN